MKDRKIKEMDREIEKDKEREGAHARDRERSIS